MNMIGNKCIFIISHILYTFAIILNPKNHANPLIFCKYQNVIC